MKAAVLSINLLQNPSFEDIQYEDEPNQGNTTKSSVFSIFNGYTFGALNGLEHFPLNGWNISQNSKSNALHVGKDVAQDGLVVAILFGTLWQTFPTRAGEIYQVSFYVGHVPVSHDPLLNQEGRIQIPGMDEVFKLHDRPADSSDHQSVTWLRHIFYFTARDEESTLSLSSLGRSNGLLLDHVEVNVVLTLCCVHCWSPACCYMSFNLQET